eukprot:CAMPEP_0168756974 /NCGR_PEP_ID=MMETSP0724-20121128/20911_1 /TAXON_ID=265536 /ORGANISM="Amphiprora sp., Strain CCMP467" /LENGTH=429 /DNA_ID=CAMNT_0008805737 /DNA_START=39 /DNA_END=1328 /DNA_ORIENTATION=+
MSNLSVVRIGPTHDNVSCTILKNAILDHFHKKEQQQDAAAAAAKESKDSQQNNRTLATGGRFQVSNRYFKAKLLLESIEQDATQQQEQNAEEMKQSADGLFHKEDGIILVFDAAQSNPDLPMSMAASFDSLDSVHDNAMKTSAKNGELLRLVVGVTVQEHGAMEPWELRGKAYEQEYSRRIMWCLDRGYEYVEANLSAKGLTEGHDDRDKEGFARIVEAISGTVWSSAVMEPKKTKQLKASFTKERVAVQEKEKDMKNPYVPPDPSLLGQVQLETKVEEKQSLEEPSLSDEQRAELAKQALLKEDGINDDSKGNEDNVDDQYLPASRRSQQQAIPNKEQRAAEREQEKMFDQLEGALREAASIREMSQSGALSDEQRRQRAGDAAVLLMNLMTQMGMDDEDDVDEDNESIVDEDKPDEPQQQQSVTTSS